MEARKREKFGWGGVIEILFFALVIFGVVSTIRANRDKKYDHGFPPYKYYYWNVEGEKVIIHSTKHCDKAHDTHKGELYKFNGFDDIDMIYCDKCCSHQYRVTLQSIMTLNDWYEYDDDEE